ncbi:hypothetical protein JMJ77_0007218, partial [Colletotrichum scovillei]
EVASRKLSAANLLASERCGSHSVPHAGDAVGESGQRPATMMACDRRLRCDWKAVPKRTRMPPAARAPAQAMIHEAMLPLATITMP